MPEFESGPETDNPQEHEFSNGVSYESEMLGENLLTLQNRQIDSEVKTALAQKIETVGGIDLPRLDSYFGIELDDGIYSFLQSRGYDCTSISIGAPPRKNEETQNVDLAFNVSSAAKERGEPPLEVASRLAPELGRHDYIAEVKTIGPFINIELDYNAVAPRIISEVLERKEHFGHFRSGEPLLVVIDYSSPNVAKDMTVAHLRSTAIGHSLMKLQQASGNIPFGTNHIGDWGEQFGEIIYEYQKELATNGQEFIAELENNPTGTLMRIYREFKSRKDKDPEAVREARSIFSELESKDPELLELWSKFREWTLPAFSPAYERLGVKFDAIQGESFYEDKIKTTIQDALEKGVLTKGEQGAVVFPSQPLADPTTGRINEQIMLDEKGNPRDQVIIKPNGGTIYLTRDLAAIRYRSQELNADRILYVIGKEQREHCLVLFAMADQLGYMPLTTAEHISFGHLNNPDGRKMSSRKGEVKLLNEVLDSSIRASAVHMEDRKIKQGYDPELTDKELELARQIGVSAIIFNDLEQVN